jgi:SAM-dependent methyltransferase
VEPRRLGLADAYSVETPDDSRALYRDWADTYESDFAHARGYVYHVGVAGLYARDQTTIGPVLDVGCGTGMAGTALVALGFPTVDGIDLSPEMMAKAELKGTYRQLLEADLTQPVPLPDASYDGVISVGTFTHGHLGPEPIAELVRVARRDALFAIGINAEHFSGQSFDTFLAAMTREGHITEPAFEHVRIYTAADDEHADDLAMVTLFRKR